MVTQQLTPDDTWRIAPFRIAGVVVGHSHTASPHQGQEAYVVAGVPRASDAAARLPTPPGTARAQP